MESKEIAAPGDAGAAQAAAGHLAEAERGAADLIASTPLPRGYVAVSGITAAVLYFCAIWSSREQLSDFAATIWFQIGLWQAVLINGAFVRRVSRTRGLGMSAVLTRGMTTESAVELGVVILVAFVLSLLIAGIDDWVTVVGVSTLIGLAVAWTDHRRESRFQQAVASAEPASSSGIGTR